MSAFFIIEAIVNLKKLWIWCRLGAGFGTPICYNRLADGLS